jgi:hypothetical protein
MRNRWPLALLIFSGCLPTLPREEPTPQVSSAPFTEPRRQALTRVTYAPASEATQIRAVMIEDKLIGENPQVAIRPRVIAVGSADPEIFHVGMNQLYITEGLVRQCQTEGQLAAVLAYELGRMISERDAALAEAVRRPEQPLPIYLPIGGAGNAGDGDPLNRVEMARFEKEHPKQPAKLARPNPQLIARTVLERAGFHSNDLDAAMPILQNAERYRVLENQFNGAIKQGDWKAP